MVIMPFNINETVKIRLTDYGRQLHRADWEEWNKQLPKAFHEYHPPKEDKNGWSQWQMWDLMKQFGNHCGLGCRPPFETTILIPVKSDSFLKRLFKKLLKW